MTDSNVIKNLLKKEEEENTIQQPITVNDDTSNVIDSLLDNEIAEPITTEIDSPFTNVLKTDDDKPQSNFDNYINNTLFDEETFDFASQDFDISSSIFNDFTEEKPQQDLTGLAKGLGIEIGVGTSADVLLSPLLKAGPYGIAAYGAGQFTVGYYANIAAQKARGVKNISQAEAIAAGLLQIVPFGASGKGLKGIKQGAVYGAGFSVSETFLRDLLGDDVTRDEYLLSLGFGGTFGAGFKGSLQGLEGIFKKVKGKTNIEADKILTKKDTKTINDAVKNIDTVSKKQKQKLKQEGLDTDKLDQEINRQKQQTTTVNQDSIPLGSRVKAADRGNIGTVVGFDESTGKFTVSFTSKKGASQSVKFDPSELTVTKRGKVLQSEVDFGEKQTPTVQTKVTQDLTFTAPEAYKRTKPRYGSAQIQFQSDFDKLSWSLRNGKKKKAQNDSKILKVFLDQGFTEKEVRLHGDKVHAKLKSIVKETTGTASASVSNTSGLNLEVPILRDFGKTVQTPLNKLASEPDMDLGNTQLNPQKMGRIKDMKKGKKDFVTQKVRTKKQEGGFKGAERRSQFDTQEGALGKMTDSKGKITGDPKRLKFITEYTNKKAILEGKLPTEEEVVINNQGLQIATDRVANSTQGFLDVVKKNAGKKTKKSQAAIDKAGAEIIKAEKLVDDWLGFGIPLGTRLGRAMNAFNIKGIEGIEGMTPAEVSKLSPLEKKSLTAQNRDISPALTKLLDQSAEFQTDLLARIQEGHKTGDYSQVIKVAQDMKEAGGSVENMIKLYNDDAFGKTLKNLNQTSRVINEVGINGVLSGLPSQRVNLYSGVAQTFLGNMKNFSGTLDVADGKGLIRKEGVEAATRHLYALMYNFDFALKVWKRSWDMEDNFINIGNSKVETGQRFVISSESPYFPLRTTINSTGKFIRLPSRLMTSNDALIQTPNILGSTAYHATMEALKKGLKGQDLDDYVKGSLDGVISYILKGQEGDLGRLKPIEGDTFFKKGIGPREFIADPVLAKIFQRAKNFGKEITYTQQIRGGRSDDVTDPLGLFAEEINNLAIQYPPMRTFFKFTRTPTNMIKDIMRYIPVVNTPARFGTNKLFTLPLIGDVKNANFLNAFLLPEIAADLRSPDPQVRTNTRGQIYMGYSFATILGFLAYKPIFQPANEFISSSEYESEDEIPKTFLTGGGPSWKTKEGAAKHLSLLRGGWLPYARAYLMYDEDGEILFDEDGQPKYNYVSYEDLPDPVLSFVKGWVDFQEMSPFFTKKLDRIYDEYTIGWAGFIGRVITNKSYVQQVDETMEMFTALPEIGGGGIDPDDTISYERQRNISYLGRLFESSVTPYSSLWEDILRLPADVTAQILGIDEQKAQELRKEGSEGLTKYAIEILGKEIKLGTVKNKRLIRLFAKMDTKTYSGDFSDLTRNIKNLRYLTSEDKLGLSDQDFNEVNGALQYLHGLLQQMKSNVPSNVGGDLPFQVEHMTNDVVTYPNRRGFNVFSNAKYSKSNNNLLHEASYTIGRLLPEPPNIIRGSKVKNFVRNSNFSSKLFKPIKLDTNEYNNLKKYVNTTVISLSGKSYNLRDAEIAYLKGELEYVKDGFRAKGQFSYEANKQQIETHGLSSEKGQIAADRIYKVMNGINQEFINAGIEKYVKATFSDEELEARINVKVDQQNSYNSEMEEILDTLNLKRF